jgi:hypothetical protein
MGILALDIETHPYWQIGIAGRTAREVKGRSLRPSDVRRDVSLPGSREDVGVACLRKSTPSLYYGTYDHSRAADGD